MEINNIDTLINFLIENRFNISYDDAFSLSKRCIPTLIQPIIWFDSCIDSLNLDSNAYLIATIINSKKPAFNIRDCYSSIEETEALIKENTFI